jgi:hypothetical protein
MLVGTGMQVQMSRFSVSCFPRIPSCLLFINTMRNVHKLSSCASCKFDVRVDAVEVFLEPPQLILSAILTSKESSTYTFLAFRDEYLHFSKHSSCWLGVEGDNCSVC